MLPRSLRLEVFGRDQQRCVCCGAPVAVDYDEAHHRRMKSQQGTNALGNLVSLTRVHHARWHSKRIEAKQRGFIVPSWADPLATPLLHFDLGWVLPDGLGWVAAEPLDWQRVG